MKWLHLKIWIKAILAKDDPHGKFSSGDRKHLKIQA